ncbi:hypothetical protein LOK49_LG08G03261 [Camellia lanceoleosa]|uniref:Uncharacterized protein n=1 Tax=Camellia lanceoleosa TaxID=1840588 RepID=A0ACC0GMU9_9ERIC|nr:hypothetical protein LOK49_LG08G03261 [Camellia lanceoleosa]
MLIVSTLLYIKLVLVLKDSLSPIVLSPSSDKSHRMAVHTFFKEHLKFLVTDAIDGVDTSSKCIRVWFNVGGNNGTSRNLGGNNGTGRNSKKWKDRGSKPYDNRGSDNWPDHLNKLINPSRFTVVVGVCLKEADELKRVFLEGNPYLLVITMILSVFHSIFDFLAFKNDIQFWNKNKSMEGLSANLVIIDRSGRIPMLRFRDGESYTGNKTKEYDFFKLDTKGT